MNIIVTNTQEELSIHEGSLICMVREIINFEGQSCCEASINFITTEEICDLHSQYFNDPSTTDCISFPIDDETTPVEARILGDVFVCPNTAIEYCKLHGGDVYEELTLYIIHGLLHLMGYDDIEDAEIAKMRAAERRHMNHLKKLDLGLSS